MRHWSQLATRNWRARASRTLGSLAAIALGTGVVVWVTCCYESVTQAINRWSLEYIGKAHITVQSPFGRHEAIPQRLTESLAKAVNITCAAPSLVQRRRCEVWRQSDEAAGKPLPREWGDWAPEIDLTGIDLQLEPVVRDWKIIAGRALEPEDQNALVVDKTFAEEFKFQVGDAILVWSGVRDTPDRLEIVGLFDRKRLARYQKPIGLMRLPALQNLLEKQAFITTVDLVLADASRSAVERTAGELRARVRTIAPQAAIRTADARMKQIDAAQTQQNFVMVLLACIAMLTSLFIILSTLSMGMVERVRQFGLLRCIGATRMQLFGVVLAEVVPIGVTGILIGIPIGLGLAIATVWFVPQYIGTFTISERGVTLAVAAGLITTFIAGTIPALAAVRVTPLEAAHPRARRARPVLIFVVALAAVAVLAVQHFAIVDRLERSVRFLQYASLALILLYFAYALLAPLVVKLLGAPAVIVAAAALRLRTRLLNDQVGQAVWRSAGICCGLMVGLSLIIGLVVVNDSVRGGWHFPKQFPEAYVWSNDQLRADAPEILKTIPGIRNATACNAINVVVDEKRFLSDVLISATWFMGCDPDGFMDLIKLSFAEGDEATARARLREGGHILIADDFARSRNKHLGDEVTIYAQGRGRKFKVAGVMLSPAIDIAAGYFQLHSEYTVIASGSVLGSNADLKRYFGVDGFRALLLNFDLALEPAPPGWPPPIGTPEAARLGSYAYEESLSSERRWLRYRGEEILREICDRLNAPYANFGTVRDLKDEIDRSLHDMMVLLTAVPSVALLVAALGVANLMTANVAARAKQIAILRAVGATRGQVLRLVVGEALVLGLVGSVLGIALGTHTAGNITMMIGRMWGIQVAVQMPWGYIVVAIVLTLGLCLLAGILPARHAARTNIVDALHVA